MVLLAPSPWLSKQLHCYSTCLKCTVDDYSVLLWNCCIMQDQSGCKRQRQLEMWANAQRDCRPAEYRWRPLFNAAKFGWCPLLQCRAVTLPRCETHWNYLGCPKLTKRSQPLVGSSSPYCKDVEEILLLNKFCPIVDTCLSCEDIARRSCAMVRRWRFFWRLFCVLCLQRAASNTFQTILNSH